MDPAKLQQAEELFHRLAGVPVDRRRETLDEQCRGDGELRSFVMQLLANDDGAMGDFLGTPAVDGVLPQRVGVGPMPKRVGRYTLVRVLGEGGMGTVYEATQERPHRTVALKLIRPGYASRPVVRRFQFETEVLGRLQHPGIACIYDAGVDEVEFADGVTARQPFFAMELIRGQTLTAYADQNRLTTKRRLELFLTICDAVHHSHQKGIIHRDLKPANILVNQEGIPKILDFGVARLTDSDLQSISLHSGPGQLIGTLQYMSPEQVSGSRSELDTRSDIYSLGVILQELLTGKLPYDFRDRSIAEAARIIRDEEPARLGSLHPDFRGDLETIVSKALEKEKSRRYPSASDLAADVRRYLNDEPISARPATTLYHLRKFARRNRGLVVMGAAAIVILLVGVVVSSALAVGQHRALRESERQRRIAEAVNAFLNDDLLAQANPESEPDRSITLREIIDRASQSIGGRFGGEPRVEAAIRTTLCETYRGLGEFDEAARHARRIVELYEAERSPAQPGLLRAHNRLALLEQSQGNSQTAEQRLRAALDVAFKHLGEEDLTTLLLMNSLALVLTERQILPEAADLLTRVVDLRTRLVGEEDRHTMNAINNLARVYVYMERFDEAEKLHLKEIDLCRRVMGPEHPDTLLSLNNLATLYNNRRDFSKAEPLTREVLEIRERVLGPDHPRTLESMDTLGALLIGQRRFEDAEPVVKHAVARSEAAHGPEHPATLQARQRLASMYLMSERMNEAEPVIVSLLEARRRVDGENHYKVGVVSFMLCRVDEKKSRLEEALLHCKQSHAILEPLWGSDDSFVRKAASMLCDIATRLERPEDIQAWCE